MKAQQQKKLNNEQKRINQQAVALLKRIMVYPFFSEEGKTIKRWCGSLWQYLHNSEDKLFYMAIARKALLDGFPLENYYFFEQPISNNAIFTSKENDEIHMKPLEQKQKMAENNEFDGNEITFEWKQGQYYAVPVETVIWNGELQLNTVDTCEQAVSVGKYREISESLYSK